MPVNKDYYMLAGSSGQGDSLYELTNSARFTDYNSAELQISNAPDLDAGAGGKLTYSFWIKRVDLGETQTILKSDQNSDNYIWISIQSSDQLSVDAQVGGSSIFYLRTTFVLRDVAAWYHVVLNVDTSQSVQTERVKLFLNGLRVTDLDQNGYPSLNQDVGPIYEHNNNPLYIGEQDDTGNFSSYYLAEFHSMDNYAYGPEYFGEFTDENIWIPKQVSGVSYGTGGWYLNFQNASELGTDTSGASNTFSEIGGLATDDQFIDTPTNNFCTLNPLSNRTARFFDGNQNADIGSNVTTHHTFGSTMGIHPSATGKYYFEIQWTSSNDSGNVDIMGFADLTAGHTFIGNALNTGSGYGIGYKVGTGNVYAGSGWTTNSFTFAGPVASNYYGFAYDASTGRLYIYQNGSALNSGDHVATFDKRSTIGPGGSIYNSNKRYNFFFGAQTSLTNSNFNYAPPTGYGPINSQRLGNDYG